MLGAMHPDSLRQMSTLADVLTQQGKLAEAEETASAAVDGCRNVYGDDADELATPSRASPKCKPSSAPRPRPEDEGERAAGLARSSRSALWEGRLRVQVQVRIRIVHAHGHGVIYTEGESGESSSENASRRASSCDRRRV